MHIIDNKIFTIGHGNRKIKDFIELLNKNGIEVLIDVRTYPYSRFHPQYRRSQLEVELNSVGIQYMFLGEELGGMPKSLDMYINGMVNYQAIKNSELFKNGITKVMELVRSKVKVTLMCSEADQNQCHRKHLISDDLIKTGVTIVHINKNGMLENESSNQVACLFD